jgi:hypothetical protein
MKLLLYCVKAKPYLVKRNIFAGVEPSYFILKENVEDKLNGKIVAECDFEVEEIKVGEGGNNLITETLSDHNLLKKSCLSLKDIVKYTEKIDNFGYAIHIKNLHIFDKPKELSDYLTFMVCDGNIEKPTYDLMTKKLDELFDQYRNIYQDFVDE